jgi:peptidoglycan hydrolase CwlO-like protein
MDEVKKLFLVMIAVFLAILLTYARFDYMKQQLIQDKINALNGKVSNVLSALGDTESRMRAYAENMQKTEDRINLGDSEIKYLTSKIESITRDLREVQLNLAIENKAANKKAIELGTVGVKKKKK